MTHRSVHHRTLEVERVIAIVLTLLMALATFASAQTTKASAGAYEDQMIGTGAPPTATTQPAQATNRTAPKLVDPQRVILALTLVLALIFTLRWAGRKFFPSIAGQRGHSAVRVLSRSPITPKQQILLVHVGKRVLVVADNGTQMSPLSEIKDPDEVAQLIGQVTNPSAPGVFDMAFGKAQESFDTQSVVDEGSESPEDRIREEPAADRNPESIVAARSEINGLMEKVRGLAQQLGRSA